MTVPFTNLDGLYIGGSWARPAKGGRQAVINPATGETIGNAPVGGKAEAEAAISAAREAFDHGPWPRMSMAERIEVMKRFRAGLVSRGEKIKALLTAEVGVTYLLGNAIQYPGGLRGLDHAIHLAAKVEPESTPIEITPSLLDPNGPASIGSGVIVRDPYGVVVGITPFNYPFLINISKVAPALITGNTVILKPSEFTPYCGLLLGEVAQEAGLPKGVLNIVTGGPEVGEILTTDARVDMVSFTGSDRVGALIAAQAAPTLKRIHMELGGKSALVVRADANLQLAAMTATFNFTMHAGQGCALATRYIVHNSIRPQFVGAIQAILGQLKMGDPADPTVMIGPLINEAARAKTERYVQLGLDGGAKLMAGGKRPASLPNGFFYEATLFDGVDNRSRLAQEEVFGPVGAVIGFDTDDEAVALANDSNFGLHGGIMSGDKAAAYKMALQMRTGQVWINGGTGDMSMNIPFGGYKRSGIGREFGPHWLDEFTEQKGIVFPVG